jgi:hypothetical protein
MVPGEPEDNTKESLHPLLREAVREIQRLSGVGGLLPEGYPRFVGAIWGTKNTLMVCLNSIGRASSFQCIAGWVAATTHLVPGLLLLFHRFI